MEPISTFTSSQKISQDIEIERAPYLRTFWPSAILRWSFYIFLLARKDQLMIGLFIDLPSTPMVLLPRLESTG
jgi:hypothetical protein